MDGKKHFETRRNQREQNSGLRIHRIVGPTAIVAICQLVCFLPHDASGDVNEIKSYMKDLSSPSAKKRAIAAHWLAERKEHHAIPYLIEMLGDRKPLRKLVGSRNIHTTPGEEAALALKGMGSPSEVELTHLLKSSPDSFVRRNSIIALTQRAHIGIISEALSDDHSSVREQAANALGEIGDKTVVPKLIGAVDDNNFGVIDAAVSALGSLNANSAVPSLVQLIKRRDVAASSVRSPLRENIIATLAKLGDVSAVSAIVPHLSDRDIDVRYAAIYAMGEFDSREAKEKIVDALDSSFGDQRFAALSIINQGKSRFPSDLCDKAIRSLRSLKRKMSPKNKARVSVESALARMEKELADAKVAEYWKKNPGKGTNKGIKTAPVKSVPGNDGRKNMSTTRRRYKNQTCGCKTPGFSNGLDNAFFSFVEFLKNTWKEE